MVPGAYKFRLDDGWGTNYGSSSATGGDLVLNGPDIPISVAGKYKVTADFNAKKYTVAKQQSYTFIKRAVIYNSPFYL